MKPLLCPVSCECVEEYQAVLLPPSSGSLPSLSLVGLNSPASVLARVPGAAGVCAQAVRQVAAREGAAKS